MNPVLDIHESIIEQISEEPKLYWTYSFEFDQDDWEFVDGVEEVFTSEDAAIADLVRQQRFDKEHPGLADVIKKFFELTEQPSANQGEQHE